LDLEEALEATDTDFATGNSKKSLVIKKGADNLSEMDMNMVRNNVEESIMEMRDNMLSGNNMRHPFRKNLDNGKSACAFCAYKDVCGFNEKENKKHKFNDLTITDKKEILEKMRGDDGSGLDK
jgi:ATP-dependent helicase/DNAse subunit B